MEVLKGEKTMLKETIKYTDYNGNERSEDFFFNLNKAEIIAMDLEFKGGMLANIQALINDQDGAMLHHFFRKIILSSVGKKSPDGRKFIKSKEIQDDFEQTLAYETLFMELITDANKAADFMNHVIPQVPDDASATPAVASTMA